MKKLLLTLLGVLTMLPASALDFEYTYEGQTLKYTVLDEEEKTCMTKEGDEWAHIPGNTVTGDLILPESVIDGSTNTDYTLVKIGKASFQSVTGLVSVIIPNSVITISGWAFEECYDLTNVSIGNSVKEIGEFAFNKCYGLSSIIIPNSVISLNNNAFEHCRGNIIHQHT